MLDEKIERRSKLAQKHVDIKTANWLAKKLGDSEIQKAARLFNEHRITAADGMLKLENRSVPHVRHFIEQGKLAELEKVLKIARESKIPPEKLVKIARERSMDGVKKTVELVGKAAEKGIDKDKVISWCSGHGPEIAEVCITEGEKHTGPKDYPTSFIMGAGYLKNKLDEEKVIAAVRRASKFIKDKRELDEKVKSYIKNRPRDLVRALGFYDENDVVAAAKIGSKYRTNLFETTKAYNRYGKNITEIAARLGGIRTKWKLLTIAGILEKMEVETKSLKLSEEIMKRAIKISKERKKSLYDSIITATDEIKKKLDSSKKFPGSLNTKP